MILYTGNHYRRFDPVLRNHPMNTNKRTTRMTANGYLIGLMAGIFRKVMIRFMHKVQEDFLSGLIFCNNVACRLFLLAINAVLALIFYVLQKPVNNGMILIRALLRLGHIAMRGVCRQNCSCHLPSGSHARYLSLTRPGRRAFDHPLSFSYQ
jgi:hypothetical protein